MLQTMDVKKVFSFVNPTFKSWDLTDNEEVAKQDKDYSLVSIEDLHNMVAMGSYVFEGLIETVEGVVEWFEESVLDVDGFEEDYVCEYRIVH